MSKKSDASMMSSMDSVPWALCRNKNGSGVHFMVTRTTSSGLSNLDRQEVIVFKTTRCFAVFCDGLRAGRIVRSSSSSMGGDKCMPPSTL